MSTSPYASNADAPAPSPCLGTVRLWLDDKGFGFISYGDGDSAFVHYTGLQPSNGRRSLKVGQQVRFDLVQRERGMGAVNVVVVG